ncbi:MAG: anion permease [Candidatus Hydrogenedentota bacterium]|nr:MAG: anion permease [Candidatus Hydrogenedentota bacterium]
MKLIAKIFASWKVLGGLYIGWGIGANDSANIFGTAVATNSVRYRTATILIAVFAILGSILEGPKLYDNVHFQSAEATTSESMALAATFASGTAVLVVTILGIPASTSQAAIGGLMGIAIFSSGFSAVDWNKFGKMVVCWVATPIGGAVIGYLLYGFGDRLFRRLVKNPEKRNTIIRWLLILSGSYGAYSLGANNVVVTTVAYYDAGIFGAPGVYRTALIAASIGGAAIALGALTYSYKVMETVGKKITVLDPLAALLAVFAHSLTLEFFTGLHVPVSSSQAIVGGVIGVGLVKGMAAVSGRQLVRIFLGWLATPLSSAVIAYVLAQLFC